MTFSVHMATLFRAIGAAAIYTPPSGPSVSLYAMRATLPLAFGSIEVPVEGTCFDLLRADCTPEVGGALTVGGVTHAIDIPPLPFPRYGVKTADPEGLKWRLLCGWGSSATIRSAIGSGATQSPPQGGPWAVTANTAAGASAIGIRSTYTVGRVLAGDRFTIAGDATVYTVTGSGAQASANAFAAVPFTPALAAPVAAGAAVTFSFSRDYAVKGALAGYAAEQMLGGLQVGDRRLIVPHAMLAAAGMTDEPKAGDPAIIGGKARNIQVATAAHQAGAPVVWELVIRG